MNNEQIWMYEGHTHGESWWLHYGWTIELLNKHATRVKLKQPDHAVIQLTLNASQVHTVRQWFETLQDCYEQCLEIKDYKLVNEIYKAIGRKTPNSVVGMMK